MAPGKFVAIAVVLLLGAAIVFSYSHGRQKRARPGGKAQPQEQTQQTQEKTTAARIGRLHEDLASKQLKTRVLAARALVEYGDENSIPFLIDALTEGGQSRRSGPVNSAARATTVRYWANEALKKISGRDFGFAWDDDAEVREVSILRWRRWYLARSKAEMVVVKSAASPAPSP